MIAKISMLDTFFFRDGKPFSLGDETWADGVFPPAPSVVYGALRSLYMANHPDGFSQDNISETENLVIKNIFLEISDQICFPVPKDFVAKKEEGVKKKNEHKFLLEPGNPELISNLKTKQILTIPEELEEEDVIAEEIAENSLFAGYDFESYLAQTDIDSLTYLKVSDYLVSEAKIGIRRSNITHATDEGMLYRVDMKRFGTTNFKKGIDVKIVVEYEGIDLPESFIKLGGEGKGAKVEIVQDEAIEIGAPEISGYFKLYLATPAIFNTGWIPEWINPNTLTGAYQGVEVELITVSIGKAVSIGGFDVKNKRPKPMLKAVPSGSIYYFKLLKGSSEEVVQAFHNQSISEAGFAKQGFGISYVAKTKK